LSRAGVVRSATTAAAGLCAGDPARRVVEGPSEHLDIEANGVVGRVAFRPAPTNTATYSYVANSPLVDHIVFAHTGTAAMTNQNTFEKGERGQLMVL
jgi:hypothetical protein